MLWELILPYMSGRLKVWLKTKKYSLQSRLYLAGETRFEHATYGFGDRYSTVEPLPCAHCIIYDKNYFVKFLQRQTGKNSHFFDAESHLAAIKAYSVPSLSQITITDGAEKVNDGRVKKMNNMRNLIHSAMIALTETRSRRRDMNKTNPS